MKKKSFLILATMVLLLTFAVGGTIAYLVTSTTPVVNTFTPAEVTVSVDDTVSGTLKSDVVITNTGNTSAYIRAVIVANWCDEAGNIVAPCDLDDPDQVTFSGLPDENWLEKDGYYYYKKAVSAKTAIPQSDALFISCIAGTAPVADAHHLEMTIIAQGIQSEGVTSSGTPAVTDAWGVTVSNGVITG